MEKKKITDKDWVIYVAKKNFAEIVHNVLFLHENNNTSIIDIENIINHNNTLSDSPMEYLFQAKRMVDCWQEVIDNIKNDKFTLNKKILCKYNKIIAKDESLLCGEFRNGNVYINGTKNWVCVPADMLDIEFDKIVNIVKTGKDPLKAAILLYINLCDKQFFFDGNKRTAFCMMNAYLMSKNILPINIPIENKTEYDKLMINYYDTKEMNKIETFLKNCHREMGEKFSRQ